MDGIVLTPEDLCHRDMPYEDPIETMVKYFSSPDAVAYEHNYWLSKPILNMVVYTFDTEPTVDQMFVDYCHELLPALPQLSHFTLSLFHEMGHHHTMMFEGEGDDALELAQETEERGQYWYMRKPNETAATMWGLMKIMGELPIVLEFDQYITEIKEYYGLE